MLPRLEDIESFLRVAEFGAFRRAASVSGVGQSTLSRRVRRLEDQLGVSLFERSSGGVRLTNAGSDFRDRAAALLKGLERAVENAGDAGIGKNGHLVIGTLASLSCGVLRSLVEDTKSRYPKLCLQLTEGSPDLLLSALRHHELDVLFSPQKQNTEIADWLLLNSEDLCVAASLECPLASQDFVSWSQLESQQLIISTRDPGPMIEAAIARINHERNLEILLSAHDVSRDTLLNLVGLNFGLTLCPRSWTAASYPNVVFIELDQPLQIQYSIAWSPMNDNPALRRFISLARIEAKKNGVPS